MNNQVKANIRVWANQLYVDNAHSLHRYLYNNRPQFMSTKEYYP